MTTTNRQALPDPIPPDRFPGGVVAQLVTDEGEQLDEAFLDRSTAKAAGESQIKMALHWLADNPGGVVWAYAFDGDTGRAMAAARITETDLQPDHGPWAAPAR